MWTRNGLGGFYVRWVVFGGGPDCPLEPPAASLGHCQRQRSGKEKAGDPLRGLRTMGTGVQAGEGLRDLGDCGQEAAPGAGGSGAEGSRRPVGWGPHCCPLSAAPRAPLGSGGGEEGRPGFSPPPPPLSPPLPVSPCRKRAAACASGSGCTPRCGRARSR